MQTLITGLIGLCKNVRVIVAALLTAGAVGGWAISTMFTTNAAAVEGLSPFEIMRKNDMKKLPLEGSKPGLIGSYAVSGTDPDGKPYVGNSIVDIALAVRSPRAGMGQRQAGRRRPSVRQRSGGGLFDQGPNGDLDHEHQSGWFALRQVVAPHGSRLQGHRDVEEGIVRIPGGN
jgi:hypothetical protein